MVVAYCLIKASPDKEFRIFAVIKRREEVKEVALTYGTFDLIAKIEVKSSEELNDFIFNILRKLPEVQETMTLLASKTATRVEIGQKITSSPKRS